MDQPLTEAQLERMHEMATEIVDMLAKDPLQVLHFLFLRLTEAPDDRSRLELMRLIDDEVVRRMMHV